MAYQTINDAAKISDLLSEGSVKVHYAKSICDVNPDEKSIPYRILRGTRFSTDRLRKDFGEYADYIVGEYINQTHVCIGSIKGGDLEDVFTILQGENWSPNGEARDLIRSKGADHTSISSGDIIETEDGMYLVSFIGFEKI